MTDRASKSDDELLKKPIIVIGTGRSGMNFLGDTIARHGTLAVATEPRLIWKHGNDYKSDALKAEDARPEVIASIRSRFAEIIRQQGKDRLIDVTPGNALRLEFVNQVFPDCQFVHFIRDGVDNVLSMRRFYAVSARTIRPEKDTLSDSFVGRRTRELRLRQIPGLAMEVIRHLAPDFLLRIIGPPVLGVRLPAMVAMRREMELLDVCFLQWRMSVESACLFGRRLPKGRYTECRIEDFSLEDVKIIFEFCQLETSPTVFEFFQKRFESKRIGPAMQDSDPQELLELRDQVEPTMQWVERRGPKTESESEPLTHPTPTAENADQEVVLSDEGEREFSSDVDWLESRITEGVLVLKFSVKRLDAKLHRKEDYRQVVARAVAAGHDRLVLDFSNLRYTNHKWGIFQLIFTANNLAKAADGQLAVCGLRGHVRRVFTFANLGKFAPEYRHAGQAVEAVAKLKNAD